MPYVHGLHIEAEDAVNTEQVRLADEGLILNVIVPRTPRISNHTDFDVLRLNPRVNLQFIHQGEEIPGADLVILPGSKSTIGDLKWLYANGWKDYLLKHLRYGGKVIGICGGYQMLGNAISDPDGIEGRPGRYKGLGFLNVETEMDGNKRTVAVAGHEKKSGLDVSGYEIHIGTTYGPDCDPGWLEIDGRSEGAIDPTGRIKGCYVHGLFGSDAFRRSVLSDLGATESDHGFEPSVDAALDALATHLEANMPVEDLLALAGDV